MSDTPRAPDEPSFVAACDALTDREAKPTVPEVLPLLDTYYRFPGCGLGGVVHIITEDSNWEQGHADWCVERAIDDAKCEEWHGGAGPRHLAIARLLQRCSGTQRRNLCARHSYPDLGIGAR